MTNSGWKLKRITPPDVEPVTLAEAKEQCLIVISDDDDKIARLITEAREAAEQFTRRAFVAQVWEAGYSCFPQQQFELAKAPLLAVISIKYTDDSGVEQTLPATDYTVDDFSEPALVIRPLSVSWPVLTERGTRVRVRFMAGYPMGEGSPSDDTENVPTPIRQAIKLHVREMYDNGMLGETEQRAWENLLHPYRVYGWGNA